MDDGEKDEMKWLCFRWERNGVTKKFISDKWLNWVVEKLEAADSQQVERFEEIFANQLTSVEDSVSDDERNDSTIFFIGQLIVACVSLGHYMLVAPWPKGDW